MVNGCEPKGSVLLHFSSVNAEGSKLKRKTVSCAFSLSQQLWQNFGLFNFELLQFVRTRLYAVAGNQCILFDMFGRSLWRLKVGHGAIQSMCFTEDESTPILASGRRITVWNGYDWESYDNPIESIGKRRLVTPDLLEDRLSLFLASLSLSLFFPPLIVL